MLGAIKGIAKGFDKAQSLFTQVPLKEMNTLTGAAIATPAMYFGLKDVGYDMAVKPMWDSVMNPDDSPTSPSALLARAESDNARRSDALRVRAEMEQLQKKVTSAAMRLAAVDPHLYNEVMAGRSLPKDAVVFGGQPRTDLMEELAMGMAQGQFKEETSAQDELLKSLGV